MKIKFGSLLATLLCGASFVTHAVPIPADYTNNYSGEYNCVLTGSQDCTQTATTWKLGYNIQEVDQQAAAWRFELFDLTRDVSPIVYESSQRSSLFLGLFLFGTLIGNEGVTLFTAPEEAEGMVSFDVIGVNPLSSGGFPILAWLGHWSVECVQPSICLGFEMTEEVASYFSEGALRQAAGYVDDPWSRDNVSLSSSVLYGELVVVPEPTSLALLGIGLAAFGVSRRRLRG